MEHKEQQLQREGALHKDRTRMRDQTGAKECLVFTGTLKKKKINWAAYSLPPCSTAAYLKVLVVCFKSIQVIT